MNTSRDLINLISKKSVLIFDVYDVLLIKGYRDLADFAAHLEASVSIPGFCEARIIAQHYLQNASDECVDLDSIYNEMHESYQSMKEKEIHFELLTAKINPEVLPVFKMAVQNAIPVYLCDRFTLSAAHIETFLKQNGCDGYRKLYAISSDKAEEEMYCEIIKKASKSPEDILYITRRSDAAVPKKLGIDTHVYESLFRRYGQNRNSAYFAVLNDHKKEDAIIALLQSNIARSCISHSEHNQWEQFGYKYIGAIAFEYAKYIGQIASRLHLKKIFFSSENGYCLKKVFESLFPDIATEMVICAKRAFILSKIEDEKHIIPILLGYIKPETTFRAWINMLCSECDSEVYRAYQTEFDAQDRIISSDDDRARLCHFIMAHKQYILCEAEKERELLINYLTELGMFDVSSAVVDIGPEMNLLSGLESICRKNDLGHHITAFYWEYTPVISWNFSLINQIKKGVTRKTEKEQTNDFLERVLSFAFSEPNEIAVDLQNSNGNFSAIYIHSNEQNLQRQRINIRILEGAQKCVQELREVDREFPFPVAQGAAMAVCEYLQKHIDQKDQALLEQACFVSNPYDWDEARPLFLQGIPVIGIANPWPQDISAEAEVITRMKRTADENHIGCILLDNFGHILNDRQGVTKRFVKEKDLSFIITTHYECMKVMNTFYYNPLWNPPEIPLNLSDYATRVTNQFIMNDDFLIYDEGGMSDHLRAVLLNCPRTLEGASSLTASFPVSAAIPPKLDKPIMFYCGMNWEIMFAGPGRHEGLFKLLDDMGKVRFYGPERVEAWGGLKPWEGYRCYKGMIPFDGFSILEKINECGVCLVLSSDTHRRAGAATNRLYEACAAGAVIISDDNEFVLKHFGDAALFIRYNKSDPIDTFNQITEKYNWILKHPAEAMKLAKRAQEIYLKKYSLDAQMKWIIQNHPARQSVLRKDLYAQSQKGKVMVTFVLDTQKIENAISWLDRIIPNVHGQIYSNTELAIAADRSLAKEVSDYCETRCACANVISMELFDIKGIRKMTDGEAIRELQRHIAHDYYINTTAQEIWFSDHLTSLVRAIEENDSMGAYSGTAFEDEDRCRRVKFFDKLGAKHLYRSEPSPLLVAGQFMFRASAHSLLPDFLFGSLDGLEHIAYAGMIQYRNGEKLCFTKRMSLVWGDKANDERCAVLSRIMQNRFICDLIRFYVPDQIATVQEENRMQGSGMNRKDVTELLLHFPFKVYILLRYYRIRMRGKSISSKSYKKYAAKYDAACEKYRNYWNV